MNLNHSHASTALKRRLRASVKYRPYLLHHSSAHVIPVASFVSSRFKSIKCDPTQYQNCSAYKNKNTLEVKQWVLNPSFRGPTIRKIIIKTRADWKLEFIVPVFLISLNVNGFMLSAGNNSPHKTHYSLFSLNTFNAAWVVFSFLFHIFIHGLSICLVIWLTYQVTKLW